MQNKRIAEYYFIYNEAINGVIKSQVIDRIKHQKDNGFPVSILSIVNIKTFFSDRRYIRKAIPDAIVLLSLGKLHHWKVNKVWFSFLERKLKNKRIVCRGPIATNIALVIASSSEIIYDGRGAVAAEQDEYGVYNGSGLEKDVFFLEKNAVLRSHKQMAVSTKLVEYWKETFGYSQNTYEIIPCRVVASQKSNNKTLPAELQSFFDNNKKRIKLVFSGGNGKWQQIEETCALIRRFIESNNCCALFLSPEHTSIQKLSEQFPSQIFQIVLSPDDVHSALSKCDYGMILRENNVTNRVASPVKIAEYLYAGLKVILSPNIGDYSELLIQSGFGIIVENHFEVQLSEIDAEDKRKIRDYAINHLTY